MADNNIRANIVISGDTSDAVSELLALSRQIAKTTNLVGGSGQNVPVITADLESIQEAVRLAREARDVDSIELARVRRQQTENKATGSSEDLSPELEALTLQTKESGIAYNVLNEALRENQNIIKQAEAAERRLADEREKTTRELIEQSKANAPAGARPGQAFGPDPEARGILQGQLNKLAVEEAALNRAYAAQIAEVVKNETTLRRLNAELNKGGVDQAQYAADIERTEGSLKAARGNLAAVENELNNVRNSASKATAALNGLSQTPADIVRAQNENLRENYAVTRALDRGFNTVSEGFGSLGSVLSNFGPAGEFAFILSDFTQLAGSIPEVTGGLSLLRANFGAFIAQIGAAKLASLGVGAALIGGAIIAIDQFFKEVSSEAEKLTKQADDYAKTQQFIADALINTTLTTGEAANLLRKEDIGQQFRESTLAVLKAVQDGTLGLESIGEGLNKDLITTAIGLQRDGGLGDVIKSLEDQSTESALAVANLNAAIDQGIPTLNSLRGILGDFGLTTVELDAATANIENIRQLIASGNADIESVTSAIDRYNRIITDSSKAVEDALEQVESATLSFQEDIAAMRSALEDQRAANLAQHQFDKFWDNIDESIRNSANVARELLRAAREQAALEKKISDIDKKAIEDIDKVVKDTIKKIADLDGKIADEKLKFAKEEEKLQTRANIDALRRLREYERARFEIERDFADKRFDAVLDNDVRAFLEANREEQKALDDLAFKFNTGESDITADADLERQERQDALNEKIAAIGEEKRAALAAQQERIDQITAQAQQSAREIYDDFHKRQEEARQDAAITDAMDAAFAAAKVARTIATTIRTTALEAAALAEQENERKKAYDEEMDRLRAVYQEQNALRLSAEESLSAVETLAGDLRTEINLLETSALNTNTSVGNLADELNNLNTEIELAEWNLAKMIMRTSRFHPEVLTEQERIDELIGRRDSLANGSGGVLPVPPAPIYSPPPVSPNRIMPNDGTEGRNSVDSKPPVTIQYNAPPLTIQVGEHATVSQAEEIALRVAEAMREDTLATIEEAVLRLLL